MQAIENRNVSEPRVLTPRERDVSDVLRSKETEKYPLSQWYLGALYALDNHYNPDSVAQAAHSLRELLEKLPRVTQGSDVQARVPGFAEKRNIINERVLKAKKRYPEGWKGKQIDKNLAKLLTDLEEYLDLNQQPTRREQIQQTVAIIDPMVNSLDSKTQEAKRNQYYNLWGQLEGFAHHKINPDVAEFNKCLEELENIVFDLLAPVTAQDQKGIQTILSLSDRSESDIERMFSLIERRGANSVFFFKQVSENADASWLPFLEKKGYFTHPPRVQLTDDGYAIYPFWWPIRYLAKISNHAPDKVIEIVLQLSKIDNPRVYDGILDIALQLHGEQSVKLTPKILETVNAEYQSRTHRYADLLAHWVKENQISAALKLSKILVSFVPDPQSQEKQRHRKEDPISCGPFLHPSPRIDSWDYREIMLKGIRPLAENEPYETARLLINATSNMFRLRIHQNEFDREQDFSNIWFARLHERDKGYGNPDEMLVHTLTFVCEKVFEKSHDAIVDLDKLLRKQKWKIFKRLRHHLYAQYPSEKIKPWIRELILEREDYHQWEHSYEFQQMIRAACDHFKEELLTKEERERIFDAIRSGPPKEDFTKEEFQKRQRYFHRQQFTPFTFVLFGEYKTYFQELESEADDPISDEDYPPFGVKFGVARQQSPRSPEHLANLKDENLLDFINEWEKEDKFAERDPFVRINIEALANAFQTVFRESVIPDAKRFRFWMENREKIERPIYVRMMIYTMQTHIKKKNFDQLNEWLTFCEWVLTHPDPNPNHEYEHNRQGDESRENPDWSNSRRAVRDFISVCLAENVPTTTREQITKILKMLCTQFDKLLDGYSTPIDPLIDPYTEGINSTRGRALEDLVEFGFWLQRHDSGSEIPEVTKILEKRFAAETEYPLTLPEYAVLGSNYSYIFSLNEPWATKHKPDFFPQTTRCEWLAAFSSLVNYSDSLKTIFEILQDDFNFALQHLWDFKKYNRSEQETIDILGQRLFTYYCEGMYPLIGEDSLLERYYEKTINKREHWANLFKNTGDRLCNSGKHLDRNMKNRIIALFEWRLKQKEPMELRQFTFWLQAECLDAEWRLNAYSKVLDVCELEDWGFHFKTLCEMLPNHTAKVVECFFKLTKGSKNDNLHIQTEEAKTILKAGLQSKDEDVHRNASQAHENLLKAGRSDLLDLYD